MKSKFLNNHRAMIAAALAASAALASPAFAADSIVQVTGRYGVGVVFDNSNVTGMQPLPGGVSNMNYAGNPTFFEGKRACAIGRDGNYAINNATAELTNNPRQPERRAVCTNIVNGTFQLSHPFGRNVDLVLVDGAGKVLGFIADDSVTPGYHVS